MVWEVGWRLRLCLDGEDGGREVDVLLQLTERLAAGLVGRQAATDGARLLGAQVQRLVLLACIVGAECTALLLVNDSLDACDRLADNFDL